MQTTPGVAVVGAYNTRQARRLLGESSHSVTDDAIRGAVADAGIGLSEVDGFTVIPAAPTGDVSAESKTWAYRLGVERFWYGAHANGLIAVSEAASAIREGLCRIAVIASGQAGEYVDGAATAPWTRPSNEWVEWCGQFTATEFALVARRHMHLFGTTPEQLATVSATIRNNGHRNPAAVYSGRGPFTPEDILASRMIADPFHLLDCAMTAEGGSAVVLAAADRAKDLRWPGCYLLASAVESCGPGYCYPPIYELTGQLGATAANRAFKRAQVDPGAVQACEFYDPFSFEVIRQFEAFGFCDEGDGGPFVTSGVIGPGQRHPICTDGGTMSYSHAGTAQMLQRVVQATHQVRGTAVNQVDRCRLALASSSGSGAMNHAMMLLGDAPS